MPTPLLAITSKDVDRLELSHCLYLSRYSGIIGQTGLRPLLQQARENNIRLGITGALLFDGERFVQLLEGPSEDIAGLVARLRVDDRHHGFELLGQGPVPARRYRRWVSGYVELDRVDLFEQAVCGDPRAEAVLDAFDALFASADVE